MIVSYVHSAMCDQILDRIEMLVDYSWQTPMHIFIMNTHRGTVVIAKKARNHHYVKDSISALQKRVVEILVISMIRRNPFSIRWGIKSRCGNRKSRS